MCSNPPLISNQFGQEWYILYTDSSCAVTPESWKNTQGLVCRHCTTSSPKSESKFKVIQFLDGDWYLATFFYHCTFGNVIWLILNVHPCRNHFKAAVFYRTLKTRMSLFRMGHNTLSTNPDQHDILLHLSDWDCVFLRVLKVDRRRQKGRMMMDDSDDGCWRKTMMMDGSPDDPKESQTAILMG